MKLFLLLLLFTAFCAQSIAQQAVPASFPKAPQQTGFLKNVGQVKDFKNRPVPDVCFQANMGGQQVFITKYGLSILIARPLKIKRVAPVYPGGIRMPENVPHSDSLCIVNYEMERIDIVLKGGKLLSGNIITQQNDQSSEFNFYFDAYQTGGERLHLQKEILVKEVYPGIDWKLYMKEEQGKQPSLKYDFIVHPGADPSLIKLRYSDNAMLELSGEGIKATTKMGIVKEEKPYSYLKENSDEVPVKFSLKKNTISFDANNYDRNNTLVIDPSIYWLTYVSTSDQVGQYLYIIGNDLETDAAGNIFVQYSSSGNTPFPIVNFGGGAYYQDVSTTPNGAMMMMKFNSGGQLLWSTYFGNGVGGRTMTIDKFGNIAAIGIIVNGTPQFPNNNPSIPLLNSGGFYQAGVLKYFIAKFSNSGQLTWSTYYLSEQGYPTHMNYDINGNIYVVGWSVATGFPVVDPGGGAYVVTTPQNGAHQVLFIAQFNAANQLTWSTRIEGDNYDPDARVCTDRHGNIYIAGNVRSQNYPLFDAGGYYQTSGNAVITRFNPARQITWSTYFPSIFSMSDVVADNNDNIYVVSDRRIAKFDAATQKVFEITLPTTRLVFWRRIKYDPVHDQLQLLGIMNDFYIGFTTINAVCNNSFFDDGVPPNNFNSATGPVFASLTRSGNFTYCSLVDWIPEFYQGYEMSVDNNGDPVYMFDANRNGHNFPIPQLTNPGNAYFDSYCAPQGSALLVKLTASPSLLVTTQVTAATGCSCNGSATATTQCGTAPYSYVWSNGATGARATGLCPGNQWVTVTDANGISKMVTVVIPYPPGSVTSITRSVIPANCGKANGSIIIRAVQGGVTPFTYSLDGISYQAGMQFYSLASGSYIVRVKDANGCVYNDTTLVPTIAGPSNFSFAVKKRSCIADDGQVTVTGVIGGVGPYQYTLTGPVTSTNSTGIFNNLPDASYQLLVKDTAGCSFVKTIVVDRSTAATNVLFTTSNDHCSQSMGTILVGNVSGGQSPYTFSTDSITFVTGVINNLNAGSYNLFVRDANGCVLKKSPVIIGNDAGPSAVNFTVTNAYCGKLTGDITVNTVQGSTGPYQYAADNNAYQQSVSFSGLQPGSHTINVKDAYGCIYSEPFEIKYKFAPHINLVPADTTVCYDEQVLVKLTGDVNQAKTITWNIPSQGNTALVKATEEKRIIVNITDSNNCNTTATCVIKVKACNTPARCVEIPTAFSPNKDGKNDQLAPLINGCRITALNFQVYNRYGQLVFETQNTGDGWDGIYQGLAQPGGAYTYLCNYTAEGIHIQKKGSFVLIR